MVKCSITIWCRAEFTKMSKKLPEKWNFTKATTAKGLTYVKAYKMRWDRTKKKPVRDKQRHVGRLQDDNSVTITPSFKVDYPEYSEGKWFYGMNNQLVREEDYRQENPETPGPEPKKECETESELNVGLTWAAMQFADRTGMRAHLHEIFGKQDGENLLYLAIYKLAGGGAMCAFDTWRQSVWLPQHRHTSGQAISDLLKSVKEEQVCRYFARRHENADTCWKSLVAEHPELLNEPMAYALDSTSISTYSKTIPEAQYGHAKRDPELKQVNYTVICDDRSGDIVFTHFYDGAVNDISSLSDVLFKMMDYGVDLLKNVLVTDRGYASIFNVQKMINIEIPFIQATTKREAAHLELINKHWSSLNSYSFYDPELGVFAYTIKENWQKKTDYGRIPETSYLHLYRSPVKEMDMANLLLTQAQEVLELKNKGIRIASDKWDRVKALVKEVRAGRGKSSWVIDAAAIDKLARNGGTFLIRSNCEPDPFKALRVYRRRDKVEQDFKQLKNWLDGDRLRTQRCSVQGKLLVSTLATALRMMMLTAAKRNADTAKGLSIPSNSMAKLLAELNGVRALRRPNANQWVRKKTPAHRERLFELLGIESVSRKLGIL